MTYDPKNPLADLVELDDATLRVIAKQTGGNELAHREAREAQKILNARREGNESIRRG